MFVAVCRIVLNLPESASLKDKRGVIQSAMTRTRNEFRVAVAEVDSQDRLDVAVLGIVAVSNQGGHARDVVEKAVRFLEGSRLDAEVGDVQFEVLQAF